MKTTNKFIKSNVNQYIMFKPNDAAFKIYRELMNGLLGDHAPRISRELKVNSTGFCKMQLWDFMKTFGQHFGRGRECIIETEMFMECETPETYKTYSE